MAHRIALIHAVRVAIQPVEDAFARHWPDAVRMNLLDDSLSRDHSRDGTLTPAMFERFATLTAYALSTRRGRSALHLLGLRTRDRCRPRGEDGARPQAERGDVP